MWGALLDYWHWTGDDTYNDLAYDALVWQAGPNKDYADKNWTASLGNDDQAFWAMSALIAAEYNFRDPPAGQPQWLALAQAVWTEQTADDLRDGGCGFGLRWQAVSLNPGFSYKNSMLLTSFRLIMQTCQKDLLSFRHSFTPTHRQLPHCIWADIRYLQRLPTVVSLIWVRALLGTRGMTRTWTGLFGHGTGLLMSNTSTLSGTYTMARTFPTTARRSYRNNSHTTPAFSFRGPHIYGTT